MSIQPKYGTLSPEQQAIMDDLLKDKPIYKPERPAMAIYPMSNIDKNGLLGVPKHANQHRLSRLTMEVHTDELRIMASEVESYTDELIAALEDAGKRIADSKTAQQTALIYTAEVENQLEDALARIAELEAREVNLPKLSVGEVMHMSGFSRDYAEGWCSGNDNAIHEIYLAGVNVAAAGKGE